MMMESSVQAEVCPVCGAPIDPNTPLQCAYCGADIVPAGTPLVTEGLLPQDVCVQLEDLEPGFHLNAERSVPVTNDGRKGYHMSYTRDSGDAASSGSKAFSVVSWAYFDGSPELAAAWSQELHVDEDVVLQSGAKAAVHGFTPGAAIQPFTAAEGTCIALFWSIGRVVLQINAGPSPDYAEPLQQEYIDQLLTLARKVNRRAARVSREG